MAGIVDLFLVYQFVARLVTPFDQWDAYKLKIIDEKGKVLRKRATLTSSEEKRAWGYFDILAANLKKLLAKFPGGDTKLMSFAAAGLLLKEQKNLEDMSEEEIEALVREVCDSLEEEIPANTVGGGQVAGLGVGSQGEPPGKTSLYKKLLKRKELERNEANK
jgi:hypothetical protein